MNVRQMTSGAINAARVPSAAHAQSGYEKLGHLARPTLAAFLAVAGRGRPVWAQDPPQQQPALLQNGQAFQPRKHRRKRCTRPRQKIHRFRSHWEVQNITTHVRPRPFPILIAPYRSIRIPEPLLTNSPRVDQLIRDGKLELPCKMRWSWPSRTAMDIAVSRYNSWFCRHGILQTEAAASHSALRSEVRQSFANLPFLNYDPTITTQISYDETHHAGKQSLISGTGLTNLVTGLASHTAQYSNTSRRDLDRYHPRHCVEITTRSSSSSLGELL